MNLRKILFKLGVKLLVELPAQAQSFESWATSLEKSGQSVRAHLAKVSPTPANIENLRHIIGIERWGQNRLRRFLQAATTPLELDEYDSYQPAAILEWPTLLEEFTHTRQLTANLAKQLATADTANRTVRHNNLGNFSARAWLRYLDIHASFESKRLK